MNNPQSNSIDRMVDGELDSTDETKLLLECEQQDRWRELALAFVEARTLQREFRSILEPEPSPSVSSHVAPGKQGESGSFGANKSLERIDQRSSSMLSLAATILLSLGLGYAIGWGWQMRPGVSSLATQASENSAANTPNPSSMHFMVKHPETQELQQIEIPLFSAKDLGPDWQQRIQTSSLEPLIEDLRQRGLNLRQQRTLTPIRLPDGRRVIVPVDDFYEQPFQ